MLLTVLNGGSCYSDNTGTASVHITFIVEPFSHKFHRDGDLGRRDA